MYRPLSVPSILALSLLALPYQASAAVVDVEVTIKSVDSASREIVVGYETKAWQKAIQLVVSPKATITLNGKPSTIGSLKPEQKATVSFDSDLLVTTKIECKDNAPAKDTVPVRETAPVSTDAERTITYRFTHAKDCEAFAIQGAHKIHSGGGLEFLRHTQGTPYSRAVTTQHFTYPITIQYEAYCLPDGVHDIWTGFACLHLHYGTWFNARTALYLGDEQAWLPHDKIVPNHLYQIVCAVDRQRMLTITKDGTQIVQRKLDDNLELSGPVILGAGLGHVVYKSVTIKGVPAGN